MIISVLDWPRGRWKQASPGTWRVHRVHVVTVLSLCKCKNRTISATSILWLPHWKYKNLHKFWFSLLQSAKLSMTFPFCLVYMSPKLKPYPAVLCLQTRKRIETNRMTRTRAIIFSQNWSWQFQNSSSDSYAPPSCGHRPCLCSKLALKCPRKWMSPVTRSSANINSYRVYAVYVFCKFCRPLQATAGVFFRFANFFKAHGGIVHFSTTALAATTTAIPVKNIALFAIESCSLPKLKPEPWGHR